MCELPLRAGDSYSCYFNLFSIFIQSMVLYVAAGDCVSVFKLLLASNWWWRESYKANRTLLFHDMGNLFNLSRDKPYHCAQSFSLFPSKSSLDPGYLAWKRRNEPIQMGSRFIPMGNQWKNLSNLTQSSLPPLARSGKCLFLFCSSGVSISFDCKLYNDTLAFVTRIGEITTL